ncbi:MAG: phage holin family protein [Myxococcota bacterium]
MTRFLVHWLSVSVALGLVAWLMPGVRVDSVGALAIGGLVVGLVNASVRPVLAWITLPITILTLGLFYLVVNAAAFGLAAWFVPGFSVSSFGAAVLGALLVSIVSGIVERILAD